MKSFSVAGHASSGALAIALLAGCGGGGQRATPSAYQAAQPLTGQHTFNYTGAKQSFIVPAGVTHITVVARGGGGDSCPRTGRGARVYAVIPVTPKERLSVYVGGTGKARRYGGFNGGGASYSGYGGGGGASDVRVRPGGLRNRVLVAAGGGAAGLTYQNCLYGVSYGAGGGGGGLTGEPGQSGEYGFGAGGGGSGGTQTGGGLGGEGGSSGSGFCYYGTTGNPGANGTLGVGGAGGKTIIYHGYYGSGGGGAGGGYFGGGGGGGACISNSGGGGGGGGSSYAEPSATKVQYWPNWKNASDNGLVVFSW